MQKKMAYDPYYSLGPKGVSNNVKLEDPTLISKSLKIDSSQYEEKECLVQSNIQKKKEIEVVYTQKQMLVKRELHSNKMEQIQPINRNRAKQIKLKARKSPAADNGIGEAWGEIFKVLEVLFYILVVAGFLGWVVDMMEITDQ